MEDILDTIEYTCKSCGNSADVEVLLHEDSQSYYECSCAEEMLPTNKEHEETMNIH